MKINPNISSLPKLVQPTKVPQHDQIVEQSRKWIAQTFYGTLLKQLRNSPFKSELFSGGRGGDAFGALMDEKTVDHMAKSSGNKLVNTLVKSIESKAARRKAAEQEGGRHVSTLA